MGQQLYAARQEIWKPFDIAYQPIISISNGAIYGYEALFRPQNGTPEQIIEIAASKGKLVELETQICEEAVNRFIRVETRLMLFLNLTPASYSFANGRVIMESLVGIPPERVVLEITECVNLPKDIRTITSRWRRFGYKLAVDDVSKGYARLTAIAELEPDFIKIDRECIAGALQSNSWLKVLEGVIYMARNINAMTIGEGIETESEKRLLEEFGVDFGQGYYFGKPEIWFPCKGVVENKKQNNQ